MKDEILSRALRIDDRRRAAAFADPTSRRLVLLTIGRPQSLGKLAEATGVELRRLHYHVTRLTRLGLLVIAGLRRRAGRPMKLYQAAADAFFIPEGVTDVGPEKALAAELRQAVARSRACVYAGVLYYRENSGTPRMKYVQAAEAGHAREYWYSLQLSRADAVRLKQDITNCLMSYAHREGDRRRSYLAHFALAPRQSPGVRSRAVSRRD